MAVQLPDGRIQIQAGDSLWSVAQKFLGNGNRWKELSGYGGDPRKMPIGTVVGLPGQSGGSAVAGGGGPIPGAIASPNDPLTNYRNMISEWYKQKPNNPGEFQWTPDAEASAKTAVGQEYRPFYQEQIDTTNENYGNTRKDTRQTMSRRGLWGAVDPNEGGPVSGIRNKAEADINTANTRDVTAFERAYTTAVAQGVQGRRSEAEDVYSKTIKQPYLDQYKDWESRLALLQTNK